VNFYLVRFDEGTGRQANCAWIVDINIAGADNEITQFKETASPAAEINQPKQRGTVKTKSREKRRSSKGENAGKLSLTGKLPSCCHWKYMTSACSFLCQ
jgi:hypothetical protein